ncbi:MAG TPA: phosphatidylglycerophosphatase A [Stellaceae bacterium]|jgi:phosphatidylglycerophosphatase A|nr:phosphatidylglycerophosphatase A [Stellaceae bacterium]
MVRLIASWFGSGLLPGAPGTWGSLAALPFAWLIVLYAGRWALLAAAIIVFFIGWAASYLSIRDQSDNDPGWIVIDEVAAQWLTLVALPLNIFAYAIGFALFRLFDIWKPWPIRQVERRCGGGFGIMIDDVLAAIYALIVIGIGRWLL